MTIMSKVSLTPNTTLYPVPVVLVTCGAGEAANVFSLNRIASCNAEPPMISISVRPSRASHDLIDKLGEFVVNIPWPDMELVSDFVGATTSRNTDKWQETGLARLPATAVQPPLLADCPVNLECRVRHTLRLPSHSLFVAEVVAMHADASVLNKRQEVDFTLAERGLAYRAGVVRERPVENFRPAELRQKVRAWHSRA
jgi:flavin reductase (DIM6/NTAB) family NADH-FMN oxidoreductase RutF